MGVDPVSMMAISAGVGLVGSAVSASGQVSAGEATKTADAYKAQVAANNAAIAKQNATLDLEAGEVAATNQGLKTRAAVGSQKVQQGASGIEVNTGSAVDVRAGTEEMGMLDALTIRSGAAKKAWSDEVQAENDTAQGQLDTMAGEQAEEAGKIGAAGTLLSGAATVGGTYAGWQQKYGSTTPAAPVGFVSGL